MQWQMNPDVVVSCSHDLVKIETLNMSGELEGGSLEILRHGAGGGDVTAKLHKCKD